MKKKFTILIAAAFMLLTMMAQPGRACGQTKSTTYEAATSIAVDDVVLLVAESNTYKKELTGFTTSGTIYGTVADYTNVPNGIYPLTVVAGNSEGSFAFKNSEGKYLSWSSGNSLQLSETLNNNSSWTFNYAYTVTTLTNVGTTSRQIKYNSSSPRFACYTSGQQSIKLYKQVSSSLIDCNLALNDAPVALEFDLSNNYSDQIVNYTTSSTGLVEIDDNQYIDTEIDQNNKTITVTPKKVTPTVQTITVNQAADATYAAGSVTFTVSITNSASVQPTEIEAFLNNNLFGTSYSGSASGITDDTPVVGTQDNVTITYAGSGNHYINNSQIRFYPNNKLTFEAPAGYEIKEIVFTSAGTWAATISANVGTYTSSTKTWTGSATSVLFTGSGSSRCDMSKADITIAAVSNLLTVTYDGNGNTGGTVPTDGNEYESDATVTVLGNTGNLEKAGYIWSGWCMNAGGTGDVYGPDYITTFTITENTTLYAKWNAKEITGLSYTGTPTKTEYYSGENFDPTGLTVTATFNDSSSEDVTTSVVWTPSPLTTGTTAVTGTYMGQTINVGGLTVTDAPGSQNNPYTVAQAIEATPASGTSANVYIHGIVSAFYNTSIVGDGSNYRYYISDDGSTTDQLLVYKGKGLDNVAFSNADDLLIGDEITLVGGLTMYQNAPEVAANNYIVSLERPVQDVATPTFSVAAGTYASAQEVEISCETDDATIYYTLDGTEPTEASTPYNGALNIETTTTVKAIAYKNTANSYVATATYHICSAETPYTVAQALAFNEYPTSTIWVHGIVSTAPTTAPSSGQLKYYISDNGEATNELYIYNGKGLNNAAFTAQDDIQVGDIVTITGIVKDYQGTLEFDSGNYLTSFERPTVATPTFTPVEGEYTEAQNVTIACETEGATIYYTIDGSDPTTTSTEYSGAIEVATTTTIKAIAAKDGMANSAIATATYTINIPAITLNSYSIEAPEAGNNGILEATYHNITEVAAAVWFCNAEGTAAAEYGWVTASINGDNNVAYTVSSNNGDARTAYFKVYALDDNLNDVYSNLVTISQEAHVQKYAVSFDLDGGTFVPNDDFSDEIVEVEAGTYSLPSATKAGFDFTGWNDGTDTYAAGAEYTVSGDVDFNAQWTEVTIGTINFNNTASGTAINSESVTGDDSMGNTWTITTAGTSYFYAGYSYCQVGSGNNPATSITFTMTLPEQKTISAFSAKFGGFKDTDGTVTLKVGDETVGTGSLDGSTDVTVSATTTIEIGTVLTVTVTDIAKGVKCYYISYTLSDAPVVPVINPTIDPIAYNATTGSIDYTIDNYEEGTMTAAEEADWINNITIEEADEIGIVTFDVTANELYVSRSATITLTFTYDTDKTVTKDVTVTQDGAPIPTYSVLFNVNGVNKPEFAKEIVEGGEIGELPEATAPNGYTFKGWANATILGTQDDAPDMVTTETTVNSDITLYAVFAIAEAEESTENKSLTLKGGDVTWGSGDGYKSGTATIDEISFTIENGMKSTDYIQLRNGDGRVYNTTALGTEITKVTVTVGVNSILVYEGTSSNPSSTTVTGDENVYTFSGNTNYFAIKGDGKYTQVYFTVDYVKTSQSTTYSNYCTTIAPMDDGVLPLDGEGNLTESTIIPAETVYYLDEIVTIPENITLTVNGTLGNSDPDFLIIEDGGQLIHDNAGVEATIKKNITGYGTGTGNYYFLVSPFADPIAPLNVINMIATPAENYDLYQWDGGETLEWRNYKQDQFDLINGKGYLYANKNNVKLTFTGALKQSNENITMEPEYNATADFGDWTLVGNPFACDAYIIGTTTPMAFYRMNNTGDGFETATGAIKPMEGIFVQASATDQSFFFTRNEPSKGVSNLNLQVAQVTNSRDAQPATDNAIIRFDNGNALEKFSFRDNTTKVYIPQGNKDYAVVSAEAQGEMPVYFKAAENGTYSISFSMDNVEFGYLHLIDNKTGNDVDLLQTSSYTFEASTIDYASRFRLVFKAIGNENDSENNDFGFFDANGNFLILGIEGTATLQVMDVMGRVISNETFSGDYSKAINASAGVYMLRLIQGSNVRTQKVVVK